MEQSATIWARITNVATLNPMPLAVFFTVVDSASMIKLYFFVDTPVWLCFKPAFRPKCASLLCQALTIQTWLLLCKSKGKQIFRKMSIPYIMCDFILISRILCASYRKLNIFAVPFRSINPFKLYISISILFWGFYEPVIWSGILCWYSWTSALVSLQAKIKEVEENISCLNDISTWWLSLISLLEFRFSFSGMRFSLCALLKRYFRDYFKDLFWISISGWNRFQN